MTKPSRASVARTPLSRERVLQAAISFVDERGIEALSMRKLAQELGVEAMSLYNHVENKDDIVDGILDLVTAEIELPPAETDWKTALRANAISRHEAYKRHPWAARVWMTSTKVSSVRLALGDAMLRGLREAGFPKELIYHAYHTIDGYVLGFTLQEGNFPYSAEELKELAGAFLRDFPSDEFPDLAEHIQQHTDPPHHEGGSFELGLDLILDGLERLRDSDG
jgi:AcrR family transcriptional regulator